MKCKLEKNAFLTGSLYAHGLNPGILVYRRAQWPEPIGNSFFRIWFSGLKPLFSVNINWYHKKYSWHHFLSKKICPKDGQVAFWIFENFNKIQKFLFLTMTADVRQISFSVLRCLIHCTWTLHWLQKCKITCKTVAIFRLASLISQVTVVDVCRIVAFFVIFLVFPSGHTVIILKKEMDFVLNYLKEIFIMKEDFGLWYFVCILDFN